METNINNLFIINKEVVKLQKLSVVGNWRGKSKETEESWIYLKLLENKSFFVKGYVYYGEKKYFDFEGKGIYFTCDNKKITLEGMADVRHDIAEYNEESSNIIHHKQSIEFTGDYRLFVGDNEEKVFEIIADAGLINFTDEDFEEISLITGFRTFTEEPEDANKLI